MGVDTPAADRAHRAGAQVPRRRGVRHQEDGGFQVGAVDGVDAGRERQLAAPPVPSGTLPAGGATMEKSADEARLHADG